MAWMGQYLEETFPGEMLVVGFATGRGQYTAIDQGGAGLRSDHVLQEPTLWYCGHLARAQIPGRRRAQKVAEVV
jgi:hypothetical protein